MLEVEYELRRASDDEIVATGRLTLDAPVESGDRLTVGSELGTVRSVIPAIGDHVTRVVVQLLLPGR